MSSANEWKPKVGEEVAYYDGRRWWIETVSAATATTATVCGLVYRARKYEKTWRPSGDYYSSAIEQLTHEKRTEMEAERQERLTEERLRQKRNAIRTAVMSATEAQINAALDALDLNADGERMR